MALHLEAQNGNKLNKFRINRKFRARSSKTVQDYGTRSADICLVMQAVGHMGHSLSLRIP